MGGHDNEWRDRLCRIDAYGEHNSPNSRRCPRVRCDPARDVARCTVGVSFESITGSGVRRGEGEGFARAVGRFDRGGAGEWKACCGSGRGARGTAEAPAHRDDLGCVCDAGGAWPGMRARGCVAGNRGREVVGGNRVDSSCSERERSGGASALSLARIHGVGNGARCCEDRGTAIRRASHASADS